MRRFCGYLASFTILAFLLALQPADISAQAFTYSALHTFCSDGGACKTDGGGPTGPLVQGKEGDLYGLTRMGGPNGSAGTFFKVTTGGVLTTLYDFCSQLDCADGYTPTASLTLGTDGYFYGFTSKGGPAGGGSVYANGTIFKMSPAGALTTIYVVYCTSGKDVCASGFQPVGALLEGSDGAFYGTMSEGGANGMGTLFKVTSAGAFTKLYDFCSEVSTFYCNDGAYPQGPLAQDSSGALYGVTQTGGAEYGSGTIFKFTAGALTTLYTFCPSAESSCAEDVPPASGLSRGPDGNFYGAAGATVFRTTSSGALTTLSILETPDYDPPSSPLIFGADGTLYGAAGPVPPAASGDLVFQIGSGGEFRELFSFCNGENCVGVFPNGIVLASNGILYGSTLEGGNTNSECYESCGTLFALTPSTTKIASTVALTIDPSTITVGQSGSLAVAVSGNSGVIPTGTVSITVEGQVISSGTLTDGKLSLTSSTAGVTPGTYPLIAVYSGDSNYSGSHSASTEVVIQAKPLDSTTTTLSVSPEPVAPPASATLTAKVTRSGESGYATGLVAYYYGADELGTAPLNASGIAMLTVSTDQVPAGTYLLDAKYLGDNLDSASLSPSASVTVK